MEKGKNLLKNRIFQLSCLIAFAGMALACSSSKDAVKAMDDFVDGYQYGRSLRSQEITAPDSINMASDYDYAMNEKALD